MNFKELNERKIFLFTQALRLEVNEAFARFEKRLKSLDASEAQKNEKCQCCHCSGEKSKDGI